MRRGRWASLLVVGLELLLATACGYRLEGRGVFLPEHIQRVYIPIFVNQSYQRDIDVLLTQQIIDELSRRGGVKLVDDEAEADAVLRGTIEEYRVEVLSTDREGRATAYRVAIRTKIVFDDRVQKKPYWQDTLSKIQDFQIQDTAASAQVLEREAIEEAVEDFAKTIVTAIFLGF